MSHSILKPAGAAPAPAGRHVSLVDSGAQQQDPASNSTFGASEGNARGGGASSSMSQSGTRRGANDVSRGTDLSSTLSGISVDLGGRDLSAEAKKLLTFSGAVQQQMDLFGDGHPQGGKIAVSYAQACNALAKESLTQGMLRTSRGLLAQAMHYLRANHSMLVFSEHQRVLAETHNNLGCLENKRGNLEPALKHLVAAVEIESELEWEIGHAATLLNTCSTMSLLDNHPGALAAAKQAVDMVVAFDKNWDQLAADPLSEAGELMPIAFNNLGLEFEFAGERQQALQAYVYAETLATRRWGTNDERTLAIKTAAWEADQSVALGQFRVRKQLKVPLKSSAEERRTLVRSGKSKTRTLDPREQALLAATGGLRGPKQSELPIIYAEANDPIQRETDQRAGDQAEMPKHSALHSAPPL